MPKKDATRSMSLTSQDSNRGVILADLVADVPIEPEHQQAMADKNLHNAQSRMENGINPAFEGNLDNGSAAVVNIGSSETVQVNQARVQNGSDISKGVILNAYLEQGLKNSNGKPVELQMGSPQEEKNEKSEKSGPPKSIRFQDMSTGRKVAFGFSFLPSIMFVLCFAVILPCQKRAPCIEVMWTEILNNTRITSPLIVPQDVVFSFQKGIIGGENHDWGLASIEVEKGHSIWKTQLMFEPYLIDCAPFTEPERQSCLVMEQHAFHLFDASNGIRLMAANLSEHQTTSLPVVLPDCREAGLKAFVTSVPPGHLKVVHKGNLVSSVEVPECDSPPVHLTPWAHTGNDTVDLVFLCRKGKEDALIRMPQSTWCTPEKGKEKNEESVVLLTRKAGTLAKPLLLPTPYGLVVWTDNDVSLIDASGNQNWTVSTLPHIDTNRFLLYGRFLKTGLQIALFSSAKSQNFLATILSFETGAMEWNTTLASMESTDVIKVNGQNKDFVLLNTRKLKWDPTKQAVAQLAEVPTTILSLLAEEEVGGGGAGDNTTSSSLVDEITFLELGGSFHSVHEEKVLLSEDSLTKTSVTALPINTEGLDIILVKTFSSDLAPTTASKMRIRNWDITLAESKQCELK